MSIQIKAIEHYLPETTITNNQLASLFEFDRDFIEQKLGVVKRHRAAKDQGCHALGHEAASKLLDQHDIDPAGIELIIAVTQNPDYKLPNVASLLQDSLGLPQSVCGLDINLGCSGFVYALATAKGLMETCGFQRGLIVTSDPYSKVLWEKDRTTVPLFGDGAAAVLVERDAESEGVGAFVFGTNGSDHQSLIVRTGGSRHPAPSGVIEEDHLQMDGRNIFNFVMRTIPQAINECLTRNNYAMEDVDCFVLHQAGRFMIESLTKRMRAPRDKVIYAMENCGNTVSSSIPIALEGVMAKNEYKGGLAVLSGFGVGLSWAATTLRLQD